MRDGEAGSTARADYFLRGAVTVIAVTLLGNSILSLSIYSHLKTVEAARLAASEEDAAAMERVRRHQADEDLKEAKRRLNDALMSPEEREAKRREREITGEAVRKVLRENLDRNK
jgi:hypothetical protein